LNTENLKRTIGLVSATSIGLGAMLGAGIFVFPGLAGGQAGFAAIISFLIGGVIALAVAVCTAELATAMPKSGGGYFYISRSFGNFPGTLTGIAQWIGLIFACAFYLVSFGEYALTILSELNIQWDVGTKVFSFCLTLFLLVLNIYGTKKVGSLQNIVVISLTIILVLIFTYGIIDYFGFENKSSTFFRSRSQRDTIHIYHHRLNIYLLPWICANSKHRLRDKESQ
jgi:amino acid transporter